MYNEAKVLFVLWLWHPRTRVRKYQTLRRRHRWCVFADS